MVGGGLGMAGKGHDLGASTTGEEEFLQIKLQQNNQHVYRGMSRVS